jgi:hypothetical protein
MKAISNLRIKKSPVLKGGDIRGLYRVLEEERREKNKRRI